MKLPASHPRTPEQPVRTDAIGIVIRRWRLRSLLLAATLGSAALPVAADEKLARERTCFACHQVDRRLVGPAWRDVANRYANDRDAEARLAKKIREGGSGAWGTLAMAPNPAVTEADAQKLARWVLSLKTSRQP